MKNPRLIILYGFAASGKTTIAKRYIDEHPLSIAIEGDKVISMMGRWRENEDEARRAVFEHTKSIIDKHLALGHTVVLPYLLTNAAQAEAFEEIARHNKASFQEIYLEVPEQIAISKLIERGVWGEDNSPRLTNNNLPEIKNLFDSMTIVMKKRGAVMSIQPEFGNIDKTYQDLLQVIE